MAREATQFKAGNKGRPKGTANKATQTSRELFTALMEGEQDHIKDCLEKVRKKDPAKYLEVLSKFYPYFIPKKVEVDQKPTEMKITVLRK